MSYKQLKWLILLIPTLTIGLWEYVRHQFLLHIISMDLGNWLSPLIVLIVTLLLITKLFAMMERTHEELNEMKAAQALLRERESIARELHDGIAQSLFLLSVKADQLERGNTAESYDRFKKIIYDINADVRQAITSLRLPSDPTVAPWMDMLRRHIDEARQDTDMQVDLAWAIPDGQLSVKEKVELAAIIRECLLNVRKHAEATRVRISGSPTHTGWRCAVADNGRGLKDGDAEHPNKYGIRMMRDRARAMGWTFALRSADNETVVEIGKEAAS